MFIFRRMVLAVLDGVGIGEMPDADRWGNGGSDTLGHIIDLQRPHLPHLAELGLASIRQFPNLAAASVRRPSGPTAKIRPWGTGKWRES
jgi:phosphopentomutase